MSTTTVIFGIYINNALVPNTITEVQDPWFIITSGQGSAWPTELNNHVTISINAGDVVEVRKMFSPNDPMQLGNDTTGSLTASMNILKVGDPIV